jgi:glycine/serine hydroxymethyltransferase
MLSGGCFRSDVHHPANKYSEGYSGHRYYGGNEIV